MPHSKPMLSKVHHVKEASSKGRLRGMMPARLRHWRSRTPRKAPPRRNLGMFLRQWHKRAGVAAFIFMMWLGASGFLINQSSAWGYDTVRIDWTWVTSLYGLKASPPRDGFASGDAWLAKAGDLTALNGEALSYATPTPLGFVSSDVGGEALLYVATRESLYIITPDGTLYDKLDPPIIPLRELVRIGATETAVIIEGREQSFSSPDGGLSWTAVDSAELTDVQWSARTALSEDQRDTLAQYSRPSMSLEQTLLDLHSGRLFGDVGVWVVNIVGILAIWLGVSGIWMTWRISRQMNSRRGP